MRCYVLQRFFDVSSKLSLYQAYFSPFDIVHKINDRKAYYFIFFLIYTLSVIEMGIG